MTSLADWITAGALAGVAGTMITLVKIAIGAERRRADDWRTAAQTSADANRIQAANVERLVTSVGLLTQTVDQLAASQREQVALQREALALLQTVANRRD